MSQIGNHGAVGTTVTVGGRRACPTRGVGVRPAGNTVLLERRAEGVCSTASMGPRGPGQAAAAMAALPVMKLGTLLLRTLSKPIANHLKSQAAVHPKFRDFIISISFLGQGSRRMKLLGGK
ncbi:OPA3-like protein [Hordeum vulgare]|nr:OPA3-like protein [Hordeum vulgare]